MRHLILVLVVSVTGAGLVACGGEEGSAPEGGGGGKGDWMGDGVVGASCTWNWQCAADQGLVCRPVSHFVDGQWHTAGECATRASFLETCDEAEDCAGGRFCKSGLCSDRDDGDNGCKRSWYCEGDAVVRCGVYVIDKTPCPTGQTCAMVGVDVRRPDGSMARVESPECVDK